MKKQKIKFKGVIYKYVITEENTIKFDGIVSYETYNISRNIYNQFLKKDN